MRSGVLIPAMCRVAWRARRRRSFEVFGSAPMAMEKSWRVRDIAST